MFSEMIENSTNLLTFMKITQTRRNFKSFVLESKLILLLKRYIVCFQKSKFMSQVSVSIYVK